MKRISILVLVLFSFFRVQGQNLFFNHLDVKDGLSHSTVQSIYQDEHGQIWFGTRNGLNKYNGNRVERVNINAGKFKHPTLAWRPESWATKKDVQLGAATNVNRSNITGITLADIQAETALDAGGEMNFFLTGETLYSPLDLAVLYKTLIGGVEKRVLFAIDEVDTETAGTTIGLSLHVVVEK